MMKEHKGIQIDSSETVIVVRTTERPKYLEKSFESVCSRSSPGSNLLVMNNCRDDNIRRENYYIVKEILGHDPIPPGMDDIARVAYREFSTLLGVPGSINRSVELSKKIWPKVKRILICDDDCIAPDKKEVDGGDLYWDEALAIMLEAGWKVAGHPNRMSWYSMSSLQSIGGIEGHMHSHLAGAYSGFTIETWEKSGGVPTQDKLFGFGPFCQKFPGKVGYWAKPQFLVEDMDRHTNPNSLRKADYFKWYEYMRPNKAVKIENEVDKRWR